MFFMSASTIIGSINPNNVYKFLNFHFVIKIILNNITSEAATRDALMKKNVRKHFAKFTGSDLHRSLRPPTLLKRKLQHMCFLVNTGKSLRTPFL